MSSIDALLQDSASAQRTALDRGEITAEALTLGYLERIDRLNSALRGFVHLDRDAALAQAKAADQRLRAGERGPVLGLVVGVKDIIDVQGMPTTYGSRAFADNQKTRDAEAVARLRRAGAVILGKTNTFEFALVMPSPLHRESRNPWDAQRVAGGSSNGSATAVSAALCSFALGSDTAGSIRNPSAYCGVAGLKPTHGRVSLGGVGVLSSSMDTVGPMARSVADCALALTVLAGYDAADPCSVDAEAQDYLAGAASLTIGAPEAWFADWIAPEVEANWRDTLRRLEQAGAQVRPVALPDLAPAMDLWVDLAAAEALAWHQPYLPTRAGDYGPAPLAILEQMKGVSAAAHARARRAAFDLRRAVEAAMDGLDVLVVPTTPTAAFPFAEARTDRIQSGARTLDAGTATTGFTRPFSVTGQPALAVPSGLTAEGMPLSAQVVGRRFDEAAVLRAGRLIEETIGFEATPPALRAGAA